MSLEKIVADLVRKVEHRFYGKYRGLVVDNADKEKLGRLKLQVPSVLGDSVVTGWALPCVPYGGDADQGFLFVPEVGAGVWVEFEEGDLEFPIWTGTFWSKPSGDSELPKPNDASGTEDSAVQDPPTRKIIKTKAGHTIQFEDADDDTAMITIVEGVHQHVITLDKNGITITASVAGEKKKHMITLDSAGITVSDKSGNMIKMDAQGIACSDSHQNSIVMNATSGFPVGQRGIDLNGGTRVCLQGLVTFLLKHKHIGNLGIPTPLSPDDIIELSKALLAPESGILSDTVKAK